MKLTQCEKGHFYDADKYSQCPHCSESASAPSANAPAPSPNMPSPSVPSPGMPSPNMQKPNMPSPNGQPGPNIGRQGPNVGRPNMPPQVPTQMQRGPGMPNNQWGNGGSVPPGPNGYNGMYQTPSNNAADRRIEPKFEEKIEPVVGWLVCTEGKYTGKDFRLVSGRSFIGRSLDSDICLSYDPKVENSNHASIIYDPRTYKYYVIPGDTGMTTLNESTLLSPQQLNDGDIIICGSTKLCFVGFCSDKRNWSQK